MSQPFFAGGYGWLFAALPIVALAGIGWLGHVPGEWGRSALLAYGTVQLAFLIGLVVASGALPPGISRAVAVAGLGVGFAVLALGGAWAHAVLAAAYAALAVLALVRTGLGIPWPLAMLTGLACLTALARAKL